MRVISVFSATLILMPYPLNTSVKKIDGEMLHCETYHYSPSYFRN